MSAPGSRVFYRLVQTNPPTLDDFRSNETLGKAPRRPLSERDRDRWRGLSMYESAEAARELSRESPWHGTYVAAIEIPAEASARARQTGRNRAHHTVWASPGDLLAWVVSVAPVEAVH